MTSDLAELSSMRSILDDVRQRVAALIERHRQDTDSPIASDLYSAERVLIAAVRHLDRATAALDPRPR